ncbi:hypothetical protein C8F04DRAFT_1188071 [Mycena alexandri]|uniref:Uncharacterized protein n=1 Tax=Mycena alexandri TaxID=1745969 RepID=A0AAD6SJ58_9AGAR|nr:hypothetical protein C8F04DRAFT_1191802 [Mycena alexandri]KAJ7028966.1 hypothetical protein C8F04DRAFT_1188071 [Mycena alexandri]
MWAKERAARCSPRTQLAIIVAHRPRRVRVTAGARPARKHCPHMHVRMKEEKKVDVCESKINVEDKGWNAKVSQQEKRSHQHSIHHIKCSADRSPATRTAHDVRTHLQAKRTTYPRPKARYTHPLASPNASAPKDRRTESPSILALSDPPLSGAEGGGCAAIMRAGAKKSDKENGSHRARREGTRAVTSMNMISASTCVARRQEEPTSVEDIALSDDAPAKL